MMKMSNVTPVFGCTAAVILLAEIGVAIAKPIAPGPISVASIDIGLGGHPHESLLVKRDHSSPQAASGNNSGLPDDYEVPPPAPLAGGPFVNFESAPVKPLALSADGTRLFATNISNNSLVVLDTQPTLSIQSEIAVGLDPVAVAVQPGSGDQFVWVANFISDNVCVVDSFSGEVVSIIDVGDEPVNILFDETGTFAFVIIQGSRPFATYELDSLNLERGNLVVIDTSTRQIVSTMYLQCQTPRSAVYDPISQRVIVAALNSGNNTTVVGQPFSLRKNAPMPGFPDQCELGCNCDCEHGTILQLLRDFSLTSGIFAASGELGPVYPDPHDDPTFPMPTPLIQRIVSDLGEAGAWREIVDVLSDPNGQPDPAVVQLMNQEFNALNAFDAIALILADAGDTIDHDLVILDAADPSNAAGLPIVQFADHVGTTLTGVGWNQATNALYVSNMEPRNLVRYERSLQGYLVDHQIRIVNNLGPGPIAITTLDLHAAIPNFHDISAPNAAAQQGSLANPLDVIFDVQGEVGFFAALGPDRVGAIDALSGTIVGRVDVGRAPRGVALDSINDLLYVLNHTDSTISTVDVADPSNMTVVRTIAFFNPEPRDIRKGRHFLYSTRVANNFASACATCHVDGHTDQLSWDLGDPGGTLQSASPNLFYSGVPRKNHPIKGPMVTQTFRGLAGHHPFHWRADRPTLESFNPAFDKLLGGAMLSSTDLADFTSFVESIVYPPNPYLNENNSYKDPVHALPGANVFANSCDVCHMPAFDGTMFVQGFDGDGGLFFDTPNLLAQLQEVTQLRGVYAKLDNDRFAGFGLLHDGREGNRGNQNPMQTFLQSFFSSLSMQERLDVTAFQTAWPSNVMSVVGKQVLVAEGAMPPEPDPRPMVELMIAQYAKTPSACDVVAKGRVGGMVQGFSLISTSPEAVFEKIDGTTISLDDLINVLSESDRVVFTAVPPGSGRRIGIDQDADDVVDGLDAHPQHAHTDDSNLDGQVNLTDFFAFRSCYEVTPLPDACDVFDPDRSGIVDLTDFNAFLILYSAPLHDCNSNSTTDLLDILVASSLDQDQNGVPDECAYVAVQPAGCRYLALTVSGSSPVALRVNPLNLQFLPQYVTHDGHLTETPVYRMPSEWGTVYVGDQDIVPGVFYLVTAESGSWSFTNTTTTFNWGDVNGINGVNLDDILCILAGFSGSFVHCSLHNVDLRGVVPDRIINLDDILAVLSAFGGEAYPGPQPGE